MSVFTRAYWRQAARQLKSVRVLAVCALLTAVTVAISQLYIPLPVNNLHIFFDYMPKAVCAAVCGPLAALGVGVVMDLLGFVFHPFGAFFPGYTVSTMVAMGIYGLGLYRQRITVARLAVTKLAVNVVCNIFLNSLWNTMLYSKGFWVFVTSGAAKNLLLWPVETAMLVLVFRLLTPTLRKMGLLDGGLRP